MNATQWMDDWQEGIDALDSAAVRLERMKHNTAVMEQTLAEMETPTTTLLQKIKRIFR